MSILLNNNQNRFVTFPIKYQDIWDMYKLHFASFWSVDEIDLNQDVNDWKKMSADERHFITMVLAFFAASDGIVVENLALRFLKEVQIPEARSFYGFQLMMENVHSETYSLFIDTLLSGDEKKKDELFRSIETIPTIKQKAEWAIKYIHDHSKFSLRLIAFACVEGIFFSGLASRPSLTN